jgi:hypothetical protein
LEIGRKIYYFVSDGTFLCDTGESCGEVRETTKSEDMEFFPQLQGYTDAQVDFIQLAYGERAAEFSNLGTMHVDITAAPPTLIIYPHFSMVADKATITPDGIDSVTVTVTIADTATAHPIIFTSSTGDAQTINTVNGVAELTVTSTSTEGVTITASSDLYGTGSITITPSTTTEQRIQMLETSVALMDAALAKKDGE